MKLDSKQDHLPSVLRVDRKIKMAARHLISLDIFDFSETTDEHNETCQEARSKCPLSSLCFGADLAAPASEWLRHFNGRSR